MRHMQQRALNGPAHCRLSPVRHHQITRVNLLQPSCDECSTIIGSIMCHVRPLSATACESRYHVSESPPSAGCGQTLMHGMTLKCYSVAVPAIVRVFEEFTSAGLLHDQQGARRVCMENLILTLSYKKLFLVVELFV